MIIGGRWENELKDDVVIENYPNLEKLTVMKNSLVNVSSLKIANNENLRVIGIEDGNWKNSSFYNVKNLVIESTLF